MSLPNQVVASEDASSSKKMRRLFPPNGECFPIESLDTIADVIENPPEWINRIAPLNNRSPTVVQNMISDCHSDAKKFAPKPRLDRRFVPKTLVCHDYKGGYLEDKHLNSVDKGNLYSFYNWNHIDIFVYFSHNLVTIPPLCWINAAHKHGVKILGTLITESIQGVQICKNIFKDEDTMRIFATSLTQIARIFKFDGWLLNIENALPNTDMLRKFVAYLSLITREENPHNLIIWYDSVIETGELRWQNELNPLNKFFFDNCDGIFLNYVWNEENLKNTIDFAKHRALDVYVGIDVFGRNTYGGGHFDCYKAAQVIRRHGLSMAIFAPGWTHETLPESLSRQIFFENFVNRDCAFWNSLWPYLYTHPIRRLFTTNFFIGTNQDIYDVAAQHQPLSKIKHPRSLELVPQAHLVPTLRDKCACLQCAFTTRGVHCLITKDFLNASMCYIHRLFVCDIMLNGTIVVHFLTKPTHHKPAHLSVVLLTTNHNGAIRQIRCNSVAKLDLVDNSTLLEVNPSNSIDLIAYVSRLHADLLDSDNLTISVYEFEARYCNLLEVGCTLDGGNSTNLCAFGIEKDPLLL